MNLLDIADEPRPCWHCGKPTTLIELDFETSLCSDACVAAKWLELFAIDVALGQAEPF